MYYAKWNKSVRERQTPYDFPHMWSLRNRWAREKREKPRETLSCTEGTDDYQRGGEWGDGWNRWWGLRGALVMMSTGWCMEVLNHYNEHLKLIQHCMLFTLK